MSTCHPDTIASAGLDRGCGSGIRLAPRRPVSQGALDQRHMYPVPSAECNSGTRYSLPVSLWIKVAVAARREG